MVIQAGTAPSELKPGGRVTASFLKRAFLDFEGEQVWACIEPGWCGITASSSGRLSSLTSDDVSDVLRGTSADLTDLAKSPTA